MSETELQTIRDFIRWGASRFNEASLFFGHGTDNAWDDAVALVMYALHLPADSSPSVLDARLTQSEKTSVIEFIRRRVDERLPVPYITGEAWFAGMPFNVDPRVLIPRSPIAELIENAFSPWLTGTPERILDLCTGSGCIGIASAMAFPEAEVALSDISTEALAVAQSNIHRYQLEERVITVESDLFSGLAGAKFDLIVSNPPYVDAEDYASMPEEFRHEPSLALVSGDDGLDFTRRLLQQASDYLNDNGALIVEVGNSWPALVNAFPQLPFTWLEFERGGHGVFLLYKESLSPNSV